MTMPKPAMRDRYLADSVATASPAKLLVMLYDRLVLDITRGEEALRNGNFQEGSKQLLHAQDIVLELRTSLEVGSWEGGPGLAQLYDFLLSELIAANVKRDPERAAGARILTEPLRDAWREAAAATAATSPAA